MSINLNVKAISRLAMILSAGLSVACGEIKLQGPEVTEATAELDGHGTLKLTSEQFPEGAETLILSVLDVGGNSHKCAPVFTLPQAGPAESVGEGLGLQTIAKPDWKHCVPVLEESHAAQQVVEEHVVGAGRVIQIKRGEEIAPIRLPAGSYQAIADFSDKSGQPLYTGTEFFEIQDGEQKALTIRLKKIASGEVTIGFEVEKPVIAPKRISANAHLELSKKNLYSKFGQSGKYMDLDLESGVAVVRSECSSVKGVNCPAIVKQKKVSLSKTALRQIQAITSEVTLKSGNQNLAICAEPLEVIALALKKCEECEANKTYKFDNMGCGSPFHNLTSGQFEAIWEIVHSRTNIPVLDTAKR
jgi:hypothetical protein